MLTTPSVTVTTDALSADAVAGLVVASLDRAMLVAEMRAAVIQQDVMKVYELAHRVCGVAPRERVQ
jgi:outer membrane lipopolysaccharide assembly protein LptE/RlpB